MDSSYGGGTIINDEGEITINTNNKKAISAIELASSWIGSISPPAVLDYNEDKTVNMFQSGNAVFMRNWPYAFGLLSRDDSPIGRIQDNIGITRLPKGPDPEGKHVGTLGGWLLGISKNSSHSEEAKSLVEYLTNPHQQENNAKKGYMPSIKSFYQDHKGSDEPGLKEVYEMYTSYFATNNHNVFDTINPDIGVVIRPYEVTGEAYSEVSAIFSSIIHNTLSGEGSVGTNLSKLSRELSYLSVKRQWSKHEIPNQSCCVTTEDIGE